MLSIIGLFTIACIVWLLLKGKIIPIIGLVLIPVLGALLAGFSVTELGAFFNEGINKVIGVVIMFVFAIQFFGLMQDAGMFDPFINRLVALSGGNILAITSGTVIIAAVAHLDGSGASTFLITIPALLPLYKRLKMSPYLLLLLVGTSASIMNMVPWGGPVGRAGAVVGIDPTVLWKPLIPLQAVGIVLLVGMAVILGIREKRRIAVGVVEDAASMSDLGISEDSDEKKEPKKLWFNIILSLAMIGMLFWGIIPAGFTFMIAYSIALPVNYPKVADQVKTIHAHAPNALMMAAIILSAGAFLGILKGTGMLDAMARDMVAIMPTFMQGNLHLIVGFFGVPFELILNTDAYYFAMFPIIEQIATNQGADVLSVTYAMIIGNVIGTFISPFSPALWLALGLSGTEMGKHIRYSLLWMWGFSLVLMFVAFLMGLF